MQGRSLAQPRAAHARPRPTAGQRNLLVHPKRKYACRAAARRGPAPHQRDPVPELGQADADGRQRRARVRRVPGQRAGVRQARQVRRRQHVLRLRPGCRVRARQVRRRHLPAPGVGLGRLRFADISTYSACARAQLALAAEAPPPRACRNRYTAFACRPAALHRALHAQPVPEALPASGSRAQRRAAGRKRPAPRGPRPGRAADAGRVKNE